MTLRCDDSDADDSDSSSSSSSSSSSRRGVGGGSWVNPKSRQWRVAKTAFQYY